MSRSMLPPLSPAQPRLNTTGLDSSPEQGSPHQLLSGSDPKVAGLGVDGEFERDSNYLQEGRRGYLQDLTG